MQFNRFQRHAVAIAIAASAFAGSAWAVDPFTVRDIRIEGLQRVEAGTIFASLPVRVGDTYDDQKGAAAIQAMFALGLFKDVRIDVSGDVLVVIVEERPTVADVEFSGNKEFDKDALRKMMRDIGLADGRPYDKALLDRAEQEIKRQYINRSLYASEVVTTVTPDRAQPGQSGVHDHRRRSREDQGNPDRRQQGVQRVDAARPVRPRHRRLAELVHQVRPVFAGQAQCRHRKPAFVLPDAWLPGVQDRFHAGGDLAGQAGDHHRHQRHRRRALRRLGRQARGQLTWARTTSSRAWWRSARARPTTPTKWCRRPRLSPTISAISVTRLPASRRGLRSIVRTTVSRW